VYYALELIAPKRLTLKESEIPRPSPGQVLIRVEYAGICSTDLAIYEGDYRVGLPLVLGHEFSGYIVELGKGVDQKYLGSLVTVEINETCRSLPGKRPCPMCQRQFYSHCLERRTLGINGWSGAFSQFVLAPVANVHLIPPGITPQEATFIEPLAAAIQTFELSEPSPQYKIAILGVGRLGNLICQVAAEKGARVIAIDQREDRLRLAKQLGAWQTIHTRETDVYRQLRELTDGCGADIVVEATGKEGGLALAMQLVRPQGTIALKTTSGKQTRIDPTMLAVNEIRIQGSRCGPFSQAIKLLLEKKIKVTPLISAIFPLRELETALQQAQTSCKVLLKNQEA